MLKLKTDLTQEIIKRFLDYDPETGVFTWIISPKYNIYAGTRAGLTTKRGCRVIGVAGFGQVKEHHLVWLYVFGRWPYYDKVIDHINGNPQDNRFSNLREVSRSVNSQNMRMHREGRAAIHFDKSRKKWMSYINSNGKRTYLGRFVDKRDAEKAYFEAKQKLHVQAD